MSRFSDFGNDLYSGKRSIDFVGRRKYWYAIAALAVILAVLVPTLRGGFNFGIEFRGGSEFRIENVQSQSQQLAAVGEHEQGAILRLCSTREREPMSEFSCCITICLCKSQLRSIVLYDFTTSNNLSTKLLSPNVSSLSSCMEARTQLS